MWLISGPFDSLEAGQVNFQKTKLLKTDTKYVLGRKERQLVVNHKKISHDHAEFLVGSYTQDDVSDSSRVSTLQVFNTKSKAMTISRGSKTLVVNPSAVQELQDGDILHLVVGISISVQWLRVCCYTQVVRDQCPASFDACASLGINMVLNLDPNVTHHLTPTFLSSTPLAYSLVLAAQIVKSEWLSEIIRLGNLAVDGTGTSKETSLEQNFVLPSIIKFRPSFSPSLPTSLKEFKVWEPNEERLNMFLGYRFLFVDEKGSQANVGLMDVVVRGGGEYEAFNVHGGKLKWHQLLAKGTRRVVDMADNGKGLVLVGDDTAMTLAVGASLWKDIVDEARRFQLCFIPPDNILESIIRLDISYLTSDLDLGSRSKAKHQPLPLAHELLPNPGPHESSIPPNSLPPFEHANVDASERQGQSDALSATSRSASRFGGSLNPDSMKEPSSEPPEPEAPRKALIRRANTGRTVIGIDDPSTTIDTEVAPILSSHVLSQNTTDYSVLPRSSRLKRRAGATVAPINSQTWALDSHESGIEPPLKKFKALFDASDPGRTSEEGIGNDNVESQASNGFINRNGGKRKHADNGAEVEMNDEEVPDSEPRAKRPATESIAVGSFLPTPPGFDGELVPKSETVLAKPDTDENFLNALASNKKWDKGGDPCDEEFKRLRISKSNLREETREQDWAVLEKFGDDRNIRGNFMVVMEIDVFKTDITSKGIDVQEINPETDFKKFKKKNRPFVPSVVELVTDGNDYGIGSGYWKGNHTETQTIKLQASREVRATKHNLNSSEVVSCLTEECHKNLPPLFLATDEEADDQEESRSNKTPMLTRQTQPIVPKKSRTKKAATTTIVDDDSDEGVTFKGFQGKRKAHR